MDGGHARGTLLRRFGSHQKGTAAVTFALAIVPMLLAGGIAVDYLRYASARTELQAALDSGALAAASAATLSMSSRVKAGEDSFDANIAASGIADEKIDRNFSYTGKTVSATARLELPAAFMKLAGISVMNMDVSTEIRLPDARKAEIALVLDYSGSMTEVVGGQVKYVAMKNAAKKLVTDLVAANPKNIKIGLVPFSHHVYVTLPNDYVAGKGSGGSWTGCTQDRQYPFNLSDATPIASDKSKWGQPFAPEHIKDGCGGYVTNNLKVMPLTGNFDAVKGQLDIMKPYAWTHIALGAEFGYHLLSPNAPFTEAVDYSDTTTRKIMVLLTDGEQTEPAFGPGARTVAQGESNLEAICANAKASGITVMTIAYNLDDTDTRKRLQACATDSSKNFFVADDGTQVSAAFEQIKTQITAKLFISR
jgi:Flp pilus assembly protein TadG